MFAILWLALLLYLIASSMRSIFHFILVFLLFSFILSSICSLWSSSVLQLQPCSTFFDPLSSSILRGFPLTTSRSLFFPSFSLSYSTLIASPPLASLFLFFFSSFPASAVFLFRFPNHSKLHSLQLQSNAPLFFDPLLLPTEWSPFALTSFYPSSFANFGLAHLNHKSGSCSSS